MSSLVDAVLNSDNVDPDQHMTSQAANGAQRRRQIRSSSRQRGPPSESAGANSDIEGELGDNEVVGPRGNSKRPMGPRGDIPRVVDVTGETLSQRFEEFLEA